MGDGEDVSLGWGSSLREWLLTPSPSGQLLDTCGEAEGEKGSVLKMRRSVGRGRDQGGEEESQAVSPVEGLMNHGSLLGSWPSRAL